MTLSSSTTWQTKSLPSFLPFLPPQTLGSSIRVILPRKVSQKLGLSIAIGWYFKQRRAYIFHRPGCHYTILRLVLLKLLSLLLVLQLLLLQQQLLLLKLLMLPSLIVLLLEFLDQFRLRSCLRKDYLGAVDQGGLRLLDLVDALLVLLWKIIMEWGIWVVLDVVGCLFILQMGYSWMEFELDAVLLGALLARKDKRIGSVAFSGLFENELVELLRWGSLRFMMDFELMIRGGRLAIWNFGKLRFCSTLRLLKIALREGRKVVAGGGFWLFETFTVCLLAGHQKIEVIIIEGSSTLLVKVTESLVLFVAYRFANHPRETVEKTILGDHDWEFINTVYLTDNSIAEYSDRWKLLQHFFLLESFQLLVHTFLEKCFNF